MKMKTLSLALLTAAVILGLPRPGVGQSFVSENSLEFTATGDFDHDGREDVVIVDKATGAYRIGYLAANGSLNWVGPRASGVDSVAGFSVGTLLNSPYCALAFTAPQANSLNLLSAADPAVAGLPVTLHLPCIGPALVTALDIGGSGNTSNDDLFVSSIWNGEPSEATGFTLVRATPGPNFTVIADLRFGPSNPPERGNRLVLGPGQTDLLGLMLRGSLADTFQIYDLSTGSIVPLTSASGLPRGCDYVYGNFSPPLLSQFLFYQPGDTRLRSWQMDSPAPGVFAFRFLTTFTLPHPIGQVFVVPGTGGPNLLVLAADGLTASVLQYDGHESLTSLTELTAQAGETFSSAARVGSSGFVALSSADGSGRSSRFYNYSASGGGYTLSGSGNLPLVSASGARGNVLEFQGEPFVATQTVLVRSLNAGDWSSALSLGGSAVTARQEWFQDSSLGLGGGSVVSLGARHPLASAGLANQYLDSISLFSFGTAAGDQDSDIQIHPAPGTYRTSINLGFIPATSPYLVRYRVGTTAAWKTYEPSHPHSIRLFTNTTVYFFTSLPSGGLNSRIRSAVYAFSESPATLDSNKDGVPDYVAVALGLDPLNSSADSDGDGFSDREEMLAGTDPAEPSDHPAAHLEDRTSFDFLCTPRPWNGFTGAPTLCETGAVITAYGLGGEFLARQDVPTNSPAVTFTNLAWAAAQYLFQVATETRYDIVANDTDRSRGTEMVRLTVAPALLPVTVPYVYGGGPLASEAAAWMASARTAYAAVQHVNVQGDLAVDDTLSALLVERKIGQILAARSTNWAGNITLFPWRTADLARSNLSQTLLLSLQTGHDGQPAYSLSNLYQTIDHAVKNSADASISNLKVVTREIYRISFFSNNVATGLFASPVDELRAFLLTGAFDTNYLPASTLPGAALQSAFQGSSAILALVHARPTATVALQVRSNSFTGSCTVLDTTVTPVTPVNLFDSQSKPYQLSSSFNLVPGSQVLVSGFTDIASSQCPGPAIEVTSMTLTSVPPPGSIDNDTLPDWWELKFFGNLGQGPNDDPDVDAFTNSQEYTADTDPTDPNSCLRISGLQAGPGGVQIQWQGGIAATQYLQRANALTPGAWSTIFTNVPPTQISNTYTDAPGANSMRYYRLQVVR
jgi:hypothetical protein